MPFTIPNEADAFNPNQAEVDKIDLDIVVAGVKGNGVCSGCAVSEKSGGADMSVDIAAGSVCIDGVRAAVSATNKAVSTADGTNPRIDLVEVDNTGAVSVKAGTAAAEPVMPSITAGRIVLAAIYVPANDTTIANNQITDKRMELRMLQPQMDIFTGNGTYTKPSGAKLIHVISVGGGGGGGSGARRVTSQSTGGGGGGAGGGVSAQIFAASEVGSTETVTIGAGGTGGAAQTTNDTAGIDGSTGGTTTFGSLVSAPGGGPGKGGNLSAVATTAATGGVGTAAKGGDGGSGDDSASTAGATVTTRAPSGGGGGGGISSTNVSALGAVGGPSVDWSGSILGGTGGAAGNPGNKGVSAEGTFQGTGGGGGSTAATPAAGFAGGDAGKYGAGGGGGSASRNGNNSGKGGDGAGGICIVYTYF